MHSYSCQDGPTVALTVKDAQTFMKDDTQRSQCSWTPPWLARLYAERAAYERADRSRAAFSIDFEAELAEVARRLKKLR